jgi:glycosyltransferase involved in cell wall biosynthesis
MKTPTPISIIIPAYNEEQQIGACIGALLPQLQKGDEIIAVNNNSTDRTAEIARSLGVKVVDEVQQGFSFARNRGFDEAKNIVLARADADTIVCKDWLSVIRAYFDQHADHATAVTGPVYLREFLPLKLGVHQGITKKTLGHETLVGGNEALTKELWELVKADLSNDDKRYAEDMEMSRIIVNSGGSIIFLPEMVVFTSARWMIRHPFRSTRTWQKKMKNTKTLLGI